MVGKKERCGSEGVHQSTRTLRTGTWVRNRMNIRLGNPGNLEKWESSALVASDRRVCADHTIGGERRGRCRSLPNVLFLPVGRSEFCMAMTMDGSFTRWIQSPWRDWTILATNFMDTETPAATREIRLATTDAGGRMTRG